MYAAGGLLVVSMSVVIDHLLPDLTTNKHPSSLASLLCMVGWIAIYIPAISILCVVKAFGWYMLYFTLKRAVRLLYLQPLGLVSAFDLIYDIQTGICLRHCGHKWQSPGEGQIWRKAKSIKAEVVERAAKHCRFHLNFSHLISEFMLVWLYAAVVLCAALVGFFGPLAILVMF
jgi:hypothetical protein